MERAFRTAPLTILTMPVLLAATLATCAPADAATVTVDWSGGGDFETIQEGVDSASPGDTVLVMDGVYTGPSNRAISFGGKDISLIGPAGPIFTRIDCGELDRAFVFEDGETAAALVRGFTIENSSSAVGGAVLCTDSSPTFESCVFAHCEADSGGALFMRRCYSMVEDCYFAHCRAVARGGAATLVSSDPAFVGCRFIENNAGAGGAVYCEQSFPAVSACEFSGNVATTTGGAVHLYWSAPHFWRCLISANSAQSAGAIYCYWSTPVLERCTLVANSGVDGGAMWCSVQNAAAVLENCIVAFSLNGPAVDGFAWFICSDVYGNEGGDWIYPISDQLGTNGNISLDPLFCGNENPGFYYSLHADSPCAAENNPGCGDVGMWGAACPPSTGADEGLEATWGSIKSLYR